MPRYNKIFAGPYTEATPQVQERKVGAITVLPGMALVESGSAFALAGANSALKVFVAQDNYLLQRGVDTAWEQNGTVIGMEMLTEQLFNLRVPTGQNITRGAALTTDANGKWVLAVAGNRIIARAEEAYNNNTGVDQLVRCRMARSGGIAP